MRTMKFRAWDNYNKKMCFGYDYAIPFEGGTVINHQSGIDFAYQLIPMQFTGILDKNNKEIYEGDILENTKYGGIFEIVWGVKNESYAGWTIKWLKKYDENECIDYDLLYSKNYENCEIAGNIYENPELTQEGK